MSAGAAGAAGRLIAVVGPSGVGKDSVIAALIAAEPRLAAVRRCVTRPAEPGGEPFEPVSTTEFEARRAAGALALHWGAHGLFYGVPRAGLAPLAEGRDLLVNLSRTVLDAARRDWPLAVLSLTASPEVLAARLAARGREDAEQIAARLRRAVPRDLGPGVVEVSNDGPLEGTAAAALAALYPSPVRTWRASG